MNLKKESFLIFETGESTLELIYTGACDIHLAMELHAV